MDQDVAPILAADARVPELTVDGVLAQVCQVTATRGDEGCIGQLPAGAGGVEEAVVADGTTEGEGGRGGHGSILSLICERNLWFG